MSKCFSKRSNFLTGFSLIELLIALGILAVGFLMILGMFPVSYKSVAQAREKLYAAHIARIQLERVLYSDYSTTGLSVPSGTVDLNFCVSGQTHTTQFIYNLTVSPDDSAGLSANTLKTAVVIVYPAYRPQNYVKMETWKARELP